MNKYEDAHTQARWSRPLILYGRGGSVVGGRKWPSFYCIQRRDEEPKLLKRRSKGAANYEEGVIFRIRSIVKTTCEGNGKRSGSHLSTLKPWQST